MGTETIWAPTVSPTFQPKPLTEPYFSIMGLGATEGMEWHSMQVSSVTMGWAR